MTKEMLPFAREHEKQGSIYSLGIPCLAGQSRVFCQPTNKATPVPASLHVSLPTQQRAVYQRERNERADLLSAFLCLKPRVNVPCKHLRQIADKGPAESFRERLQGHKE